MATPTPTYTADDIVALKEHYEEIVENGAMALIRCVHELIDILNKGEFSQLPKKDSKVRGEITMLSDCSRSIDEIIREGKEFKIWKKAKIQRMESRI